VVFCLNTTLYGLMVAAVSSSQPGLGTSLVDILTTSTSLTSGCQMSWNYFGSGHGKGEVDGASALLKRQIRIEQIKPQGRKLQNATKIVEFLKEQSARVHVGPRGARCTTSKFFWEIKTAGIRAVDREDTRTVNLEHVPFRSLGPVFMRPADLDCEGDCFKTVWDAKRSNSAAS
jgi:hypothetical protein